MDRDALSARLVKSLQELNVRRLHRRKAAEESVKSYYDVSLEAARASGDEAWLARLTGTVRSQWRYGQSVRLNLDRIIPELLERLILENNEGFDRNHEDLQTLILEIDSRFPLKTVGYGRYLRDFRQVTPDQSLFVFVLEHIGGLLVQGLKIHVTGRYTYDGQTWADFEGDFSVGSSFFIGVQGQGHIVGVEYTCSVPYTVAARAGFYDFHMSSQYRVEFLNDYVFDVIQLYDPGNV